MIKTARFFLSILLLLIILQIPAAHCEQAPVKGSAEELFFDPPATAHSYKKSWDLHVVLAGAFAVAELEFVRIGDGLVSLPVKGEYYPFRNTAEFIQHTFYSIPQVKPVRRFEQLGDALQLRQLGLSDFRFISAATNGEMGGGLSANMEVRIYKIIVLVEDLIDDSDRVLMYPVNRTMSNIKGKPVRIETLGYAADGLGYLRWQLFQVVKAVNKVFVKTSLKIVSGAEGVHNRMRHSQRSRHQKHYIIYLKVPATVYNENRAFFEDPKKKIFASELPRWRGLVPNPDELSSEFLEKTRPYLILQNDTLAEEIIIAVELESWRNAPLPLRRYVIDPSELPG